MLEAKACAAVRCAEGLPSSDSHYDLLMRLQEYGDAVTEMSGDIYGDLEELGVASSYRWRHGRSSGTTRLFYYSPDDVVVDVASSNTDGAVQTVANKADAAWHTGATVVAANVAAVSGSEHMEGYRDDMIEQNIAAWGKEYQSVVGERVLNSMSAETYQDPSNYVLDFGLVVADAVPLLGLAKKSGEAVEKTAEALRNLNRAIGEGLQAQHAMRRADDLGEQLALSASNQSRGLTFVGENLGAPRNSNIQNARDFESGTTGAFSDIATNQRHVPALRYDNPNPNGAPFVKFDGHQQLDNGIIELIDSKTRIVPFSTREGPFISPSVRDGLVRKSEALSQNPGYRGVIELPSIEARREAQQVLRQLGITNISTRVRQ
jgi:hypothetical protein